MSSGKDLQEMEAGTKQSQTAVNSGAKSGDPMPTMADPGTQLGSIEDLGGPTPDNYKSDDDSAKLKEPSLKTVADIVKKGAKPAEAMASVKKEETEAESEEVVAEEETTEEEVVSEEETTEAEEETVEEEVVAEEEETYSVEEDVNALLQGEELSEEFQEKARTIFESALRSKVSEIQESLEVQYETKLVEEVEGIKTALTERVDSYLEYVSTEWMSENRLSVEAGLKEELNNSFMSGLKNLFEEHYVAIPEDKYDVLESMVEKLDEMETKLNEQIDKNISLNKRLSESVADRIFDEISEGLAATQKEKFASLSESVEFESETSYREKLETLKEAYFAKKVAPATTTETLSEGTEVTPETYTDSMASYLRTLSSVVNKK
nr:scaffold prohead core protein [uncultured Mediterranean phage uvMED]